MKLIVGLGNPGVQYEHTRHNMGFDVIDILLKKENLSLNKSAFNGRYIKTYLYGEDVIILKPETFMNLSGECVRNFISYYKIDLDDLLIIYDDMDLPCGKIRLREHGSAGGHNGMQNIIDLLHTSEINRIRVGIGKADRNFVDYVLSKPSNEESELILSAQNRASEAIITFIKFGFMVAKAKYFQ